MPTLKIDRSFIQDLVAPSNGSTIVAGIAAMAKGLHLNVVAEGVETRAQLEYLKSVGCDAYQGYLFSRPVAAREAMGLLKTASRAAQVLPDSPSAHASASNDVICARLAR